MKKDRKFLIWAIAVNNIGDIVFDLFIAWGLSTATGNFMNAVYVIGTSVAFRAILSFFMGAFVDKHSKKKLMIISHLLSMVVIMLFGIVWETAKQFISIGIIFVLMNDINNEMFSRSYISMTADIFNENDYIKFQSISNITVRIVSIAGAALAGILIENASNYMIFLIDIVTYAASLGFLLKVSYHEERITAKKEKDILNRIIKNTVSDIKYTFESITNSSYLSIFVILMFLLNLAYGYIPQILPVFKANKLGTATLLGLIKSALTVGEIVGLAIVNKYSRYVSCTFKISMLTNMFIVLLMYFTKNFYVIVFSFFMYGLFDSLTQPLFGYTVSKLDSRNRGKLLGGIDAIILFSPSIGIYTISMLTNYNEKISGIMVSMIFLAGYLIVSFNKDMNNIVLDKKNT